MIRIHKAKAILFLTLFASISMAMVRSKSAEEFVRILEENDYWYQSPVEKGSVSDQGSENYDELLRSRFPFLHSYNQLDMDYKYRAEYSDTFHDFSILELYFKNTNDIHYYNNNYLIQIFPECAGIKNTTDSDMQNIFPLWNYKELVRQDIRWDYREYIEWYAIRYDRKVFVIYAMRLGNINSIKGYAELLYTYLLSDTKDDMNGLVRELHANKIKAPVAYDSVKFLQSTLLKCGFDPGELDGKYGEDTEKALLSLFIQIGYIDSSVTHSNISQSHLVRMATRKFQKNNGIPITGRCGAGTIKKINDIFFTR